LREFIGVVTLGVLRALECQNRRDIRVATEHPGRVETGLGFTGFEDAVTTTATTAANEKSGHHQRQQRFFHEPAPFNCHYVSS